MMVDYYILKNGILKRRENTVYFINKDEKKPIPIAKIRAIFIFGSVTITSGVLRLLSEKQVPLHIYSEGGYYRGSFFPTKSSISGFLVIKQAEHYLITNKRKKLATKFVEGSIKNMIKTISRYNLDCTELNNYLDLLDKQDSVNGIRGIEGQSRKKYYSLLNSILPEGFKINKRKYHPPNNEINALISFGNSLLYSEILNAIYQTPLTPTISYLHEPGERRFSLALDLSEIFKPFIVDRLIIRVLNKKLIQKKHFIKDVNYSLLKESGKRIFISSYLEKLNKTIYHRRIKRRVSYRQLIKLEVYKLIKHIIDTKEYEPFTIWW